MKAAFENYGTIDSIIFMCDGYPNTALSRGCGACACSQSAQWIVDDSGAWIASKVALNSSFLLRVVQISGSPVRFMVDLGSKSNATFILR